MSPLPSIVQLLTEMVERRASDLHLTPGVPPSIRIDGEIQPMNYDVLKPQDTENLAYSLLNDQQKKTFEQNWELDLSIGVPNLSRFRGNVFRQRGNVAMVLRQIPFEIKSYKDLGLPPVIAELAKRPKGLILVTGPTGSGKSTTLASMIDQINQERRSHIITVEDPIEFLFKHKRCLVNQRQVGSDTKSFTSALKYALRQDPDIVMIGEMRDLETIQAALTISETGHLTFATLHTNSAAESINRVIDVFPEAQQGQVRAQLAFVIIGIMTQTLIPKVRGGRSMAMEILAGTPAIKALIRDDKVHQIYSLIQAGKKYGMQTMNQALFELYKSGQISLDNMMANSREPEELEKMLSEFRKASGNV
ncbi:MAG: type IV pilus twitching motility protein PilT [bacterium]|nr:type IV pilus twitching motility protein PilT [bacterium]